MSKQFRVNIQDILGPALYAKEASAMSFHFRNLKVKEWSALFGAFLAVFIVGALIRFLYPSCWFAANSIYALADALMVAGIIGASLEMFSAKFLVERVADDLAQRLVGRGLPRELQAHIQKITKTEFVWSNYVKRYTLIPSDIPGKMLLQADVSFEVRNYSDLVREYSPMIAEEEFYSPKFLDIEYGLNGEVPTIFNEAALASKVVTESDGRVKKTAGLPKIKLPPMTDDKFAKVLTRYQLLMPTEYTDLTHFGGATIGVKICLENIPKEFDFSAEGEDMVHVQGSRSWDFNGPFVGGQHVRVRWFKKPQYSN